MLNHVDTCLSLGTRTKLCTYNHIHMYIFYNRTLDIYQYCSYIRLEYMYSASILYVDRVSDDAFVKD